MYTSIFQELTQQNIILKGQSINPKHKIQLTNRPELYNRLIELTHFVKPHDHHLRERLYCVINNITQLPTCSSCESPVSFICEGQKRNSYHEFCSLRCSNNSDKVKQLKKETALKKFGVENPSQSQEIKTKKIQTSLLRYNANYPWQEEKRIDLLEDYNWMNTKHIDEKLNLSEIGRIANVHTSVVSAYMKKHNIAIQHYFQSAGENEVCAFIQEQNIKVIQGTRSIIPPLELDMFIPSHNVAIEYNGLYWHSEQSGKDKHYHKNKYDLCKDQGIQLITIFEDEWEKCKEQVQNKLLTLLNKNKQKKVHARKCSISIVGSKTKKEFLNIHHIQQNGPSSINIGLEFDGNLVALAAFQQLADKYYLTRFASSCSVRGGFSKILKYFTNNYPKKPIVSFADLRWSNGNLYEKTGWELDCIIPPDYYYSPNGVDRFHKFNYRRRFLSDKLKNFDETLSERENCDREGILRIWDCGKLRYVLTP